MFIILQKAAGTMTDVAEYINEVKRLHENALRVQEILGSMEDLEVSLDSYSDVFQDLKGLSDATPRQK